MCSLHKMLPPADVSKLSCVRSRVTAAAWAYFYAYTKKLNKMCESLQLWQTGKAVCFL